MHTENERHSYLIHIHMNIILLNCSTKQIVPRNAAHGNCDQIRTVWERIIRRATEWNTLFKYARVRSTPTPEAHSIRRLMRGIKKPQAWRGLAWHINPSKSLPAGCLPVESTFWKKERRTDSEKLIVGKRLLFLESEKLENSVLRTHLYTLVRRHASGKHLTKRSGIHFIPRGLTAAYFPVSQTGAARRANALSNAGERAGISPSDPCYKMPSSPILPRCTLSTFHSYPRLSFSGSSCWTT